MKAFNRWSIILAVVISVVLLLGHCNVHNEEKPLFLNLQDSVTYVGMETCKSCHQNVYETFVHTGMGRSFDLASIHKSDARFDAHALVYDSSSNFYYKPFFEKDTFYIQEFRLEGTDTIYSRTERIDYIIGSGHHTNSHLINRNGYVYQAPITFYTQKQRWDLAPGFENGKNLRFKRIIATECLTCHNHLPKHVQGSENKYETMPTGIECERCHGPGSLHVNEKLAGNIVDTSLYVDYTIVNPHHLDIDLQMDLCQRCHLQGIAVLNPGKTFYDFRPGMVLSDVLQVYLPRFEDSDERFIMASQADRLRQSACFLESKALSCINCHNPHKSVHATDKQVYNKVCKDCHNATVSKSTLTKCSKTASLDANCVDCHMPKTGSIDIPHIRITDHFIGRSNAMPADTLDKKEQKGLAAFLGLENLTNPNPSDLEMARGYLALYDKFMGEPAILDSVDFYLARSKNVESTVFWETKVHYLFAKKDYVELARYGQSVDPDEISDAWSSYRVGEGIQHIRQLELARRYIKRATDLRPYNLDFKEKLGVVTAQLGDFMEAVSILKWVLDEQPQRASSWLNLGMVYAQQQRFTKALKCYDEALRWEPDYAQAFVNKAAILMAKEDREGAKKALNQALRIVPNHPTALELMQQLN